MKKGTMLQKMAIPGVFKYKPFMIPIVNEMKMEINGFLKKLNLIGLVSHFIETNEQKIVFEISENKKRGLRKVEMVILTR